MITLITPGGGRHAAFALCEHYMQRQTVWGKTPIQWIVADDYDADPVKCTLGQEHIFGSLRWKPGLNTLRYNLAAALPLIKGDYVFIIENDDFFSPDYIATYLDFLKHADLVGSCNVTYYSLQGRGKFKHMKNFEHASTTQTAFRKSYIPHFEQAVHSGEQYFDILLWNTARMKNHRHILFHGLNLCVGMKNLPGRRGVGVGHTPNDFTPDANYVKLQELVGVEDAIPYIAMMEGK